MIKKVFLICISFWLLQSGLYASMQERDIVPTMTQKIDTATDLIEANKGKESTIANKLYEIFDPVFDYELMAKISLGSKQYRTLTKPQRKEYIKEFEEKLKSTFMGFLGLYSGERVKVESLQDDKSRKVLVTKLIGEEKTFSIDYRFHNSKTDGWLIYDIKISNVSVVQSYKNQFANVVFDGGYDKLISLLKASKIDVDDK